ncbi:hypothetical protein DACRYDRAFT_20390 [Dacryopinax primogenitus]|uniref:Uncharacterized protein n=1 Tax=Dacryopinax primogenitus (strain DJM 731) TaxID=1858805 RepID=M5GG27_DACPD|nr:uncharacterized protein DACRYDRAFT_20390 [Dacryopinax primogenitus]EJU04758.1 hypothetical protein DACRYDRAFT_20390 [Dacryopinax primogenitus]
MRNQTPDVSKRPKVRDRYKVMIAEQADGEDVVQRRKPSPCDDASFNQEPKMK